MSKTWDAVDEYYAKAFGASDPVLAKVLTASKKAGLPDIQVSPLQGRLLMLLAQSMGAKRILEVGTLGGYSTIWMARALPADGRLVTVVCDSMKRGLGNDSQARSNGPVRGFRDSPCKAGFQSSS